jgi:hypothetical protein
MRPDVFAVLRARLVPSLVALFGVTLAAGAEGKEASEPRVSRSSYYAQDGREQRIPDKISVDEVQTSGSAAAKAGRRSERDKGEPARSRTPNTEFWFYAVDVELFADEDLDGYFYGIDLLFDADTVYEHADVYAVLYLSREGGPWYEYAATDVFPLYGATSDDDFVVESELLSGYPAGSYDILIELYDTWDNAFVADIGPESTPELGLLPLEDAERDKPVEPPVVVVEDGGGGADPAFLGLLAITLGTIWLRRWWRPRPSAAVPRAPRA